MPLIVDSENIFNSVTFSQECAFQLAALIHRGLPASDSAFISSVLFKLRSAREPPNGNTKVYISLHTSTGFSPLHKAVNYSTAFSRFYYAMTRNHLKWSSFLKRQLTRRLFPVLPSESSWWWAFSEHSGIMTPLILSPGYVSLCFLPRPTYIKSQSGCISCPSSNYVIITHSKPVETFSPSLLPPKLSLYHSMISNARWDLSLSTIPPLEMEAPETEVAAHDYSVSDYRPSNPLRTT